MTDSKDPDAFDPRAALEVYERECVAILPEAIEEEYVRVPADLAYWNAAYAQAVQKHLRAKAHIERIEALVRIEAREKMLASGVKPTESQVDAAVVRDDRVADAQDAAIVAEVDKVRVFGILDAVRTKRDMLVSLGAHIRAEMERDPSIRERHRGRAMVRDSG